MDEKGKETVAHALRVAQLAGVSGICAMPNTTPPLTERDVVQHYLSLADQSGVNGVFFGCYLAMTSDRGQVRRAVQTYRNLFPRVVGFKMYAGHSTNNIGVIHEADQRGVFETLAWEGYEGVLAVHAEKQAFVNDLAFDYTRPITHAELARPPQAEVVSIEDMIRFKRESGFKGKLHITHISTHRGVEIVDDARRVGDNVSCGVTPHHLWYRKCLLEGPDGLQYKMNPPLRSAEDADSLLEDLRAGKIQVLETDHAPHESEKKQGSKCASGMSALYAWQLFLEGLRQSDFSEELIGERTHGAVERLLGISVPRSRRATVYRPDEYGFNPWFLFQQRLGFK